MSPSVRFVHCGGFHFDSRSWEGPASWVDMRNKDLWKTFEAVLNLCRTKKADFLFLTGNLFEQEYVCKETVERVARSLAKLKNTKVFISPGKKDPLITSSVYRFIEWPENVHIFPGGLSHVEVPTLGVTIYGAGWTTYYQEKNFLQDFQVDENSENIHIMLLHAEVEASQLEASGLDYLALGHQKKYSGIQQTGKTYWADCGEPEARSFQDSGSYGVIFGETDRKSTRIEFLELEQHTPSEKPPQHETIASSDSFPTLIQVFTDEIQDRLASINHTEKQGHWKLVQRIGLSALCQRTSSPEIDQQSTSGLIFWPESDEDDLYRRVCNLREVGDEYLSLEKAQDSLERAKKRVEEQSHSITQAKEEYNALRRDWDAENRKQEEQRLLIIESKKLQAKQKHLTEIITAIMKTQERLTLLHQNPDYRELRRIQGELSRLDEVRRGREEELTNYTNHTKVDWVMIENLREECLQWAGHQEAVEHLNNEVQQFEQKIKEIEKTLLLSGYQEVPENEDIHLIQAQEERDAARNELDKMTALFDQIKLKEEIYDQKVSKLQAFTVIDEVTPVDERNIKKTVRHLSKWQNSKFSGSFDRLLKEQLGWRGVEASLSSRLNRYYQKYKVADYEEFQRQQQELQERQQEIVKLQTELESLRHEAKQEQVLCMIIRSRSEMLKKAFNMLKVADLQEWLKGWEDYQLKKSRLAEMQDEMQVKIQQQKGREAELVEYASQLRDKVRNWVSEAYNVDELLVVVMKVASKLRAKEEAEKELITLKQLYDSQLGKRDIDLLTIKLEPLADLEREGSIADEKRLQELSACQKELTETNRRLDDVEKGLQLNQKARVMPDLEKKLQAVKQQWKSSEELQQGINDTIELLEACRLKWLTSYGKALETLAKSIFSNTFSLQFSTKKEALMTEVTRYYFAYRIAFTLLSLEKNPETPISISVGEMKEPKAFWEEVLTYLQDLSQSRQVRFTTSDSRLRELGIPFMTEGLKEFEI